MVEVLPSRITAVQECDARDDDSSTAAGQQKIDVRRPDFIGIPLRFTRDDDSSTAAG